jgi:hypothetical protein
MNKLITLACMGIMFSASSAACAGAQQEKMKSCNKSAKSKMLKGDERKAFMKSCLSGKTTAPAGSAPTDPAPENKPGHKK